MKRIILSTLALSVVAFTAYVFFEPAAAAAADDVFSVSLTVTSEISITDSSSGAITMLPAMNMTQQNASGSSTITVKTNDHSGYTLSFKESAPNGLTANAGANYFTDMATSTPTAYTEQSASVMKWGFSAFGGDVLTTWNVGGAATACGSTANADFFTSDTALRWAGLYTTATTTNNRSSQTPSAGVTTVLCVVAEYGDSIYAPNGSYTASLTATATLN